MRRSVFYITIAVLFAILGLLIWTAVKTQTQQSYGTLVLNVKPDNTTIEIDGERGKQGKQKLPAGNHTVHLSRRGFADMTFAVSLNERQTTTKNVGLEANSPEGFAWAKLHPGDALQSERLDPNRDAQINQIIKDSPVITKLPYHSSIYNIDYGRDAQGNQVIYITSQTPLGRQVALALMRSWGYDPTDYLIVFRDFTNPFATQAGVK